ncbi:MAG TPA: ATP-binding protein [Lentimicrobium sp.]|nr:ATP-binding protein [Lentimicrobium sp.]
MKDLSMHMLDIAQNSITANATMLYIEINENNNQNLYSITIKDNGIGMSQDLLTSSLDPFFTTRKTRKVGLGIPLLKQNCERTGGNFLIDSTVGAGTTVKAEFIRSHPDFMPIGDLSGTIVLLTAANPEISFKYLHITKKGQYLYDTNEILKVLDGVSVNEPTVRNFLKEMINENLKEIEISK